MGMPFEQSYATIASHHMKSDGADTSVDWLKFNRVTGLFEVIAPKVDHDILYSFEIETSSEDLDTIYKTEVRLELVPSVVPPQGKTSKVNSAAIMTESKPHKHDHPSSPGQDVPQSLVMVSMSQTPPVTQVAMRMSLVRSVWECLHNHSNRSLSSF